MDSSAPKFPDLKWAQRKDRLFITICLPEVQNPNIDLKPEGKFKFNGKVKETKYEIDLDLYGEIVPDESKWNHKGRNIYINVAKKDKEAEYWPRFTKEKMKHPHIFIDWDKWIEEEDENEGGNADLGNFDLEGMQDFNMGDYEDSDDEEEEVPGGNEEAKADLDDLDAPAEADTGEKSGAKA